MANEFFDALPIHAFQSTMPLLPKPTTIQGLNGPIELKPDSRQRKSQLPTSVLSEWRELVITPTPLPSLITTSSRPALNNKKQTPEFQLSVAEAPTRASLIIPEASPRYRVLKNRPGSIIEVSPDSIGYVSDIAKRIDGSTNSDKLRQSPAGAALIIDYGPESTVPASTLRGIRAHELVSPLSSPGEVDISVDVDFQGLADATIDITKNVDVYGPIEQGSWLQNMGIQVREDALTKHASDAEHSESIRKSIRRLTERGGGGMGRIYKVLAIVAKSDGKTHPAGF